ncbi:DUF6933 domain-containing protein [Desulfurivibrio alkaliphilus]|uniref:DUF6933 domain-containing protein n=1 Tax=Desulfurivibrio alkaliphilus (strain DSM 19089 / UNIQEM U267 / AHT2) TaxID=589865 RepID=D6Z2C8_DESAT|nr:hypothetical protein [Desulfurivibrio alkaliphilus]ADH85703.1 hypothetical protein DaAHT2_1002 [Desulfurivibrio alkaliphilus AHT 2]
MIRLHCTKKLLVKLPCDADGRLKSRRGVPPSAIDAGESPLSGWHAKLLLLQRRQCVLFVAVVDKQQPDDILMYN